MAGLYILWHLCGRLFFICSMMQWLWRQVHLGQVQLGCVCPHSAHHPKALSWVGEWIWTGELIMLNVPWFPPAKSEQEYDYSSQKFVVGIKGDTSSWNIVTNNLILSTISLLKIIYISLVLAKWARLISNIYFKSIYLSISI